MAINGAYTICALNNDLSQMDQLKTNAWSNETNPKLKPIGKAYGYISKQWHCLWVAKQCLDQWPPPYEGIFNPFLVSHDHASLNSIGAYTISALTNGLSQMESLKTIALSNDTTPPLKCILMACKSMLWAMTFPRLMHVQSIPCHIEPFFNGHEWCINNLCLEQWPLTNGFIENKCLV